MLPTIYGNAIFLRPIRAEDANDLLEVYGDAQTMQFASDPVFDSLDMIAQMLESVARLEAQQESIEWAVTLLATNKVIGTCGLHNFDELRLECEVGCLLNSNYWRRGYMSEALGLLFEHARQQGVTKLLADVDTDNVRSHGLFDKLGFTKESGVLVRYL